MWQKKPDHIKPGKVRTGASPGPNTIPPVPEMPEWARKAEQRDIWLREQQDEANTLLLKQMKRLEAVAEKMQPNVDVEGLAQITTAMIAINQALHSGKRNPWYMT